MGVLQRLPQWQLDHLTTDPNPGLAGAEPAGPVGHGSPCDLRAGDNLGWPEREGAFVFDKTDRCYLHSLPEDDARYGYDYPVAAYDHDPPPDWSCSGDVGRAISGGYVYRGHEAPELYGKYIFGDLVDGRVFYTSEREMRRGRQRAPIHQLLLFDRSGERVTMQDLAGDQRIGLRFGRDRAGELYLISKANGKARIDARVRIDTPVDVTNRDVIIVFGYRSDTQFYYAHLSADNTIYPHNGIFKVDNADRLRIEDQWDAVHSRGAAPAITDTRWHDVRVVHCAGTGQIAVYVDRSKTPLMTAVDTTFTSGRVGFGSFDNIERLRDLEVTGTRVDD